MYLWLLLSSAKQPRECLQVKWEEAQPHCSELPLQRAASSDHLLPNPHLMIYFTTLLSTLSALDCS